MTNRFAFIQQPVITLVLFYSLIHPLSWTPHLCLPPHAFVCAVTVIFLFFFEAVMKQISCRHVAVATRKSSSALHVHMHIDLPAAFSWVSHCHPTGGHPLMCEHPSTHPQPPSPPPHPPPTAERLMNLRARKKSCKSSSLSWFAHHPASLPVWFC